MSQRFQGVFRFVNNVRARSLKRAVTHKVAVDEHTTERKKALTNWTSPHDSSTMLVVLL